MAHYHVLIYDTTLPPYALQTLLQNVTLIYLFMFHSMLYCKSARTHVVNAVITVKNK